MLNKNNRRMLPDAVILCCFFEIEKVLGNDQLSQRASPQVPSALASLTAGFGM
jgi:hypothetical protein